MKRALGLLLSGIVAAAWGPVAGPAGAQIVGPLFVPGLAVPASPAALSPAASLSAGVPAPALAAALAAGPALPALQSAAPAAAGPASKPAAGEAGAGGLRLDALFDGGRAALPAADPSWWKNPDATRAA